MSNLPRYTPIGTRGMTPCSLGEWVRYEDATSLRDEEGLREVIRGAVYEAQQRVPHGLRAAACRRAIDTIMAAVKERL
jgi:hypothetical protein